MGPSQRCSIRLEWGTFRGDYRKFHKTIVLGMPPEQVPNYYLLGANQAFEKQTPFTV
jgi:hypothetical protein